MTMDLKSVLNGKADLDIVVTTDIDGKLLAEAGEGDSENLCAVGQMCAQEIAEAGRELNLGESVGMNTMNSLKA